MSVLLNLYDAVKSKVLEIPSVKHFDWWNSNIDSLASNSTPFRTPAVFFTYSSIDWEDSLPGNIDNYNDLLPNQHGTVDFDLHIIVRKNNSSSIDLDERDHLLLSFEIYKKLHFSSIPEVEGKIQRTREADDVTSEVMRDWVMTFRAQVIECGLSTIDEGVDTDGNAIVDVPQPVLLELELDFDPNHYL